MWMVIVFQITLSCIIYGNNFIRGKMRMCDHVFHLILDSISAFISPHSLNAFDQCQKTETSFLKPRSIITARQSLLKPLPSFFLIPSAPSRTYPDENIYGLLSHAGFMSCREAGQFIRNRMAVTECQWKLLQALCSRSLHSCSRKQGILFSHINAHYLVPMSLLTPLLVLSRLQ